MLDGVGDFFLRGPDVVEIDGLAGLILAERIGVEVVADVAGERVGDDERRGHQIICAHVDVDAALEVAIAAEHADGDEAVLVNAIWTRRRAAGRSCRCRWCSRSRRR